MNSWRIITRIVAAISVFVPPTVLAFVVSEPSFRFCRRPSSMLIAPYLHTSHSSSSSLLMTLQEAPTTFREAEILGLKLMREGNYDDALNMFQKAMQLKGSRSDVIRSKRVSGPSPVGGSTGGMESRSVDTLDEFEIQAAHYNMACVHAHLGNLALSIDNLQIAFENGFDNYSTVRGDPDLDPIKSEKAFEKLMQTYEPKGFNPFERIFGKK